MRAYALVAPLILALVVVAAAFPWRGVWGVDNRTYAEMIDGVRRHGLPYTTNGDIQRFPEAVAPFNVPSHGRLWGEYPPLFAYVAAPALALGGLRGVTRLNLLLVAATAWSVFRLGRRVTGSARAATIATYAVVLSSPLVTLSFQTLGAPLMVLLVVLACHAAVDASEASGRRRLAFSLLTGVLGGLAVSAHLVALPMVVALLLGLAIVRGAPSSPVEDGKTAPLMRLGLAAGAFAATLLPLAVLNGYRFGSFNPVSYGPCVWEQCKITGTADLSPGALVAFAWPAVPWLCLVVAGLWLSRRSRLATAGVILVSAAVLVPHTGMHDRVLRMARTVLAYVVHPSIIDVRVTTTDYPWFWVPPDGLGALHVVPGGDPAHGTAIKSLLECTPFLALALATRLGRGGDAGRRLLLALPVVALFAQLALLAKFEGAAALGWPNLYMRYALAAVPLLAILGAGEAATLPLQGKHALAAALIGLGLFAYFARGHDDVPLARRVLETYMTLIAAALALAALLAVRTRPWARPWASAAVALSLGVGVGVSLGVDGCLTARAARDRDRRMDRLEALTPPRFALAGWGPENDEVLALRAERDIEYVDLTESRVGWTNFRKLIDVWSDRGLPVFGVFPDKGRFRWPYADWDVPAELLDEEHGIWSVGPPRVPAPP